MNRSGINRRRFLKTTGLAAVGLAATRRWAEGKTGEPVTIIVDPDDQIAATPAAQWAVGELQAALAAAGAVGGVVSSAAEADDRDRCVLVADAASPAARAILAGRSAVMPAAPESLCLAEGEANGRAVLLAGGSDGLGLAHAVSELADRVRLGANGALAADQPLIEQPASAVRSVMRSFVSETEDKPWFYDREYWKRYLSMLATQRFNRFNLALGLGYNSARGVTDGYFVFPYPFFVTVAGLDVRAEGLSSEERDRNLDMLRFISDETAARGLQFQLGLWTHAYVWNDSPNANYLTRGLTPETHAPYCREALSAVLDACPAITGLTFRVHGESGIPEGDFAFWKTLFEAIPRSGEPIEIDLHAKGVPEETLEIALATGMPVNLSPKYWAEHMGLPYHAAAIREQEMARPDEIKAAAEGLDGGSRKFMRYGYGDLLAENRRYGVLHRIWPGTQRFLLWGDPATAAGYGRNASFCGSRGIELMEPLSFKGRQGTGQPGGRCAYADPALNPRYDFEKYLYTYRLWGRLGYNPDSDPEVWRRLLRQEFGPAAGPAEQSLALASRMLPLITTVHGPSASNNTYWPEIYTDMPIVDPNRNHVYRDTPEPKVFGTVSPFDPQLFSSVDGHIDARVGGTELAKYSPEDVAAWLEQWSETSAQYLARAAAAVADPRAPEFRRLAEDVRIQNALGRFFADKIRTAALWRWHERTREQWARDQALSAYRRARETWQAMAIRARTVYAADIAYGVATCRGSWLDRLPAIDGDLADLSRGLEDLRLGPSPGGPPPTSIATLDHLGDPARFCRHRPPGNFLRGGPLAIDLECPAAPGRRLRLHYRQVNEAERWQTAEMSPAGNRWQATIPGDYTQSRYPLQYYFDLGEGRAAAAALYPAFNTELSNQPYFVVRSV